MNEHKVHFNVRLAVHDGKLAEFEGVAREMTAGTNQEKGVLHYDWYFSADKKSCRLIETYVNADAVMEHVNGPVVQVLVPKILQFSSITNFEVYGPAGKQAGGILKGAGAELYVYWGGIAR